MDAAGSPLGGLSWKLGDVGEGQGGEAARESERPEFKPHLTTTPPHPRPKIMGDSLCYLSLSLTI